MKRRGWKRKIKQRRGISALRLTVDAAPVLIAHSKMELIKQCVLRIHTLLHTLSSSPTFYERVVISSPLQPPTIEITGTKQKAPCFNFRRHLSLPARFFSSAREARELGTVGLPVITSPSTHRAGTYPEGWFAAFAVIDSAIIGVQSRYQLCRLLARPCIELQTLQIECEARERFLGKIEGNLK